MMINFTKTFTSAALLLTGLNVAYAQNPQLLKDIIPGDDVYNGTVYKAGSSPTNLIVANGELWFEGSDRRAESPTNGHQVYKTDGTTEGTVLVKVLQAPLTRYGNLITGFTGVPNGTVFF